MTRVDGRKAVGIAVGGITLALGVGTIYLPYFADRDKIRGLFEDENKTPEELMKIELQHHEKMRRLKEENETKQERERSAGVNGNSMWSNLRWGIAAKKKQQPPPPPEENES